MFKLGIFGGNKDTRDIKIEIKTGDVNGDGRRAVLYCVLHDCNNKRSDVIELNTLFSIGNKKEYKVTAPIAEDVQFVEVWTQPGCVRGNDKCFLDIIHVNGSPFPFNRWIPTGPDCSPEPYFISKYDYCLPQVDLNGTNRAEAIRSACETYELSDIIDGFAKLYPKFEVVGHDILGLVTGDAVDVVDALDPFHKLDDFQDYAECYIGELRDIPTSYTKWQSDVHFGLQRVMGVKPAVIELCKEIPENFGVTHAMVAPFLEDNSLENAMKEKKLYIINYEILDGIKSKITICAPMALFYINKNNDLVPIAIQLEQAIGSEIFLPSDDKYVWLLAKMHFNNADANYHETISHLGFTHLVMETVLLSVHRSLSPSHPVFRLLAPHFLYLMPINALAFKTLIDKGGFFDTVMSLGTDGMNELLAKRWKTWKLDVEGCLPNDLKNRGVDDVEALSNYPYRDDAMLLYKAIRSYVAQIINSVYDDDDKKFKGDYEIQSWAKSLLDLDMGACHAKKEVGFENADALIETVTSIIFTCSVQHAAVNFAQYNQYGYPPNYPSRISHGILSSKAKLTEKDVVARLPTIKTTMSMLDIMFTLSQRATDSLGYFEVNYLYAPKAEEALANFRINLKKISAKIKLRNHTRIQPYDILDPQFIPNAISI